MEHNTTETAVSCTKMIRKGVSCLLIIGLVTAVALSCGLTLDFETDIGHFRFGAPSFYLMAAGVIAATVLSALLGKYAQGKFSLIAFPDAAPLSTGASYFAAFLAVVAAAASLYDIYIMNLGVAASNLQIAAAFLLPALPVSLILGAHEKYRSSVVRIFFALLAALAVNVNMFACYFDFTLPLNSAVRNLITIAQAGVVLFLLSEARLALSHETRATAPFFVFTSAFAASAVSGISLGLCVFAFVSPNAIPMEIPVYRFACYFGIGILALSRLLALKNAAGPYVPPPEPKPDEAGDENENENDGNPKEKKKSKSPFKRKTGAKSAKSAPRSDKP
ncbi:MAG: hypothetical protein J6C42_07705 [Clostridia bacterium]|nr:hypothetical protein [Clostridia bacterium]